VWAERASFVSFAGPKRFYPSPLPLGELPAIDLVLLSHDHADHLDPVAIRALAARGERFVAPLGVGAHLEAWGVAPHDIQELDWWAEATHAGVHLTATPAQHFSGRTLSDRNRTLWASWVIQSAGQRIFYSGDSGYFEGYRQIGERFGGFDLALIENGAYDAYWPAVHMTPEQSVQAFEDLRGKVLFSVHNSTFDLAFHTWRDPLDRVAALTEKQGIPLATPEIGEVLTLGKPRSNVLWWKSLR
jgi:L-ascorbate metabolism protein UlaG (beta-lactamase superfamily)